MSTTTKPCDPPTIPGYHCDCWTFGDSCCWCEDAKRFARATFVAASSVAKCDGEDCHKRALVVVQSEEFAVDIFLCRDCASATLVDDDEVLR